MNIDTIISDVFSIKDTKTFNEIALEIFRYQAEHVPVYREYVNHLNVEMSQIKSVSAIPFIPIQLFKSHIISDSSENQVVFKSSGTTATGRSHHYVRDIKVYEDSFNLAFEHFFGDVEDYKIVALLPNYIEQGDSSLVYMVDNWVRKTKAKGSLITLNYNDALRALDEAKLSGQKTILIGVSYALLDLGELLSQKYPDITIIETGGMKGRRKEMTKEELHSIIMNQFGVGQVSSEYGMTELLSQGYSTGGVIFRTPPWMKVFLRETNDPLSHLSTIGKTGGINIIDLANIHSCSFIATQDLGRLHPNGFEVMGRFDYSDTRGCNLLVQ